MWTPATSQKSPSSVEITVRDLDAESKDSSNTSSSPLSMGSLLRLFRSEFFDAFMAVTYLYRYRHSGGVHDYLCNQLYGLGDADLEAFMPQVCNLLAHHSRQSPALERFVMDKCADSMHIALQVFWFLQAAVEDAARKPDASVTSRVRLLRSRCETTAVNGSKRIMLEAAAERISVATLVASEPPFSPRTPEVPGQSLFSSRSENNLVRKDKRKHSHGHEQSRDSKTLLTSSSDHDHYPSTETAETTMSSTNTVTPSTTLTFTTLQSSEGDLSTLPSQSSHGPADEYAYDVEDHDNTGTQDDVVDGENKKGNISDVTEEDKITQAIEELNIQSDDLKTNTDDEGSERKPLNGNIDEKEQNNREEEGEKGEEEEDEGREKYEKEETNRNKDNGIEDSDKSSKAPKVPSLIHDFDPLALLAMKQERCDYFNDSISIAKAFVRLSLTTRELPQDQRMSHLTKGLQAINNMLLRRMKGEPGEPLMEGSPPPDAKEVAELGLAGALRSIHLPLTRASSQALRILRVHTDEVIILTSRTRAPYMVNIEVLPTDMLCSDKLIFCEHRVETKDTDESRLASFITQTDNGEQKDSKEFTANHGRARKRGIRRLSEMTPEERQIANVRKAVYGDAYTAQPEVFAEAAARAMNQDVNEDTDSADYKLRHAVILGIYGELWSWKEERILAKSPFRGLKGAKLMPFIVKAGDDLRQEQLAIQLIGQFEKIFKMEGVGVYLKPFTVMSVSSEAGFVEVIKDAVSVHALKKRTPNFTSLLNYFERAYGAVGTDGFRGAQRRFIESMAGYSLVTYFLQIKDRHNGNIMVDVSGRIIHIDFGFMLTNSPGAIKFENVPFKLTEEYLQVICARDNVTDPAEACRTEGYRYFQELFVLGMLAARKHYEKITTLVEIMTEGTTMPCMTNGQATGQSIVEALRGRFAVGIPEGQCIRLAMNLIEESRLSWRSAGYDRFQAYSNGYR